MKHARPASATRWPTCRSRVWMAAAIFGLFIVIALCAGLVFNIVTVALPKIVDERLGADVSLILVGGARDRGVRVRRDGADRGGPAGGEISAAHSVRR